MGKGICSISVAPLRAEHSHQSEMVSQILYGESMEILESSGSFSKVRLHYDAYEGYVDTKQIAMISEEEFGKRTVSPVTETFGIYEVAEGKTLLSMGSEVNRDRIPHETPLLQTVAETAMLFLNVPYLWSGRSFFGIDCSGFTQLVYKMHGISLPRDACQQAEKGEVLDFVEESQPGDLAFFENEERRIIHVGIMLEDQKIIHAYGKVRIDTLDSSGIFNQEVKRHTHKLRFIRRVL